MERLHHIDVAKGISIILVVANHSALRAIAPEFFNATSSLRLPLFFFLSGIFFSVKWPAEQFVLRKADALLKPYVVTLLALQLLAWLLATDSKFGLAGVFYASGMTIELMPLWFLPHLFLVHTTAFWLVRSFAIDSAGVLVTLSLLVLGFLTGAALIYALDVTALQVRDYDDARVGWPLSLDVLCMSLSFFMTGYLLRQRIRHFKPNKLLVLVFGFGFVGLNLVAKPYLDFNGRILMQPVLVILGSMLSVYCVLAFSYWLAALPGCRRWLVRIGQAGLIILVFHSFFVGNFYRWLLPHLDALPVVHAIIVAETFFLGIAGPLVLERVIQKVAWLRRLYLPIAFSHKPVKVPVVAKG
jgi:fucose 4-O-acetylase-like acetyltransferase